MTLRIKAFNNSGQFDEIHVTQIKQYDDDLREYIITKPYGPWKHIMHHRNDGWLQLMKRVIDIIDNAD